MDDGPRSRWSPAGRGLPAATADAIVNIASIPALTCGSPARERTSLRRPKSACFLACRRGQGDGVSQCARSRPVGDERVDGYSDGQPALRAVEDGGTPEAVVPPAGHALDAPGEDALAGLVAVAGRDQREHG